MKVGKQTSRLEKKDESKREETSATHMLSKSRGGILNLMKEMWSNNRIKRKNGKHKDGEDANLESTQRLKSRTPVREFENDQDVRKRITRTKDVRKEQSHAQNITNNDSDNNDTLDYNQVIERRGNKVVPTTAPTTATKIVREEKDSPYNHDHNRTYSATQQVFITDKVKTPSAMISLDHSSQNRPLQHPKSQRRASLQEPLLVCTHPNSNSLFV
ncbi:hypothetical protein RFI_23745, partial [Reticulomyxa filosa]